MTYQISHAPAASIAKDAIWVAQDTKGGGTWMSPAQLAVLLGITPPVVVPPPPPPPPPPPTPGVMPQPPNTTTKTFSEYFPGTTLSSQWQPNMGDKQYGVWRKSVASPLSAMNAGGYDTEYFSPANLTVANNTLTIDAVRDTSQAGYTWRSGCIRTGDVFSGGVCQVRAQMPAGNGMWAGLWFLDGSAEIDLQESGYTLGSTSPNNVMACNSHTSGTGQKIFNTGKDLTTGFHDYRVTYVPGSSLIFELDEVEVASYSGSQVPTGTYELIIDLQVAVGSQGWHTVADTTTPATCNLVISAVEMWT